MADLTDLTDDQLRAAGSRVTFTLWFVLALMWGFLFLGIWMDVRFALSAMVLGVLVVPLGMASRMVDAERRSRSRD